MELLLLHGNWNEKLPEFASAPQLPPRKVSRPPFPVLESFSGFEEELGNNDRITPGESNKDQLQQSCR